MSNTRVKIGSIVQNQLPDFVQEEYPLVGEFLKEYYDYKEPDHELETKDYFGKNSFCKVELN